LNELKDNLRFILAMENEDYVYVYEKRGHFHILKASPIEIARDFRDLVLDRQESAIFTSATLSTMNNFSFIKKRLGFVDNEEKILPSPFELEKQVAIYIDKNLPDPRYNTYFDLAAETAQKLLKLTRGRALFLFTSYKMMHAMYDRISPNLQQTILVQGEGSKSILLSKFREDIDSILFATASFWQGIDVPGEALSCVIIDKLPFAVPSEPIVEARIEKIREQNGNPFMEYQVPAAILSLKQGFGRLIRKKDDRGIIALLDSRVLHQRYGQYFLNSFNRYPLATSFTELLNILPPGMRG
jgi:ATP-dependent DNA helicase DinG